MSSMTNESDDGICSNNSSESPAIDIGSGYRSRWDGDVMKKGPWTAAEDSVLIEYVKNHGEGNWNAVRKFTGLSRCGKSCRLRWANHLRPNLKKGAFSQQEEQLIVELHAKMGNKWARMAAHLPGRTDNEIKNYWNTRIKRRQRAGLPLYPPDLHLDSLQSNEEEHNDITRVHKRHRDFWHVVSGMMVSDIHDHDAATSYKDSTSFTFSSPRGYNVPEKNHQSFNGGHTLMEAMFPTSSELPSFQFPETHSDLLESSDAYIRSPPPMFNAESDYYSSSDSGLLDMLLHEAKIRSSTKNTLIPVPNPDVSSAPSPPPTVNSVGRNIKSEQWDTIGTTGLEHVKETSTMSDSLMAILGEGNKYMHMAAAGSSSQARASYPCAWTNMPSVCQITELP